MKVNIPLVLAPSGSMTRKAVIERHLMWAAESYCSPYTVNKPILYFDLTVYKLSHNCCLSPSKYSSDCITTR